MVSSLRAFPFNIKALITSFADRKLSDLTAYISKYDTSAHEQTLLRSYLNDSDDVSETALQEVSVDEHAEGEAGTTVAVYHLPYEPRA